MACNSVGMSISAFQPRCASKLGVSAAPTHHVPLIAHNLHNHREVLARTATQSTGLTIETIPVVDLSIQKVAYEVRTSEL
jgi:hypothetical protein